MHPIQAGSATSRRNLIILAAGSLAVPGEVLAQPKSTADDKQEWKDEARYCDGVAAACVVSAGVATATGAGAPVAVGIAVAGGICKLYGWFASGWAADPPDPNFKTIAKPQVKAIQVSSLNGIANAAVRRALSDLLSNVARVRALSDAMLTSVNRSTGASLAKAPSWRQQQVRAAKAYALQLAAAVEERPKLFAQLKSSYVQAKLRVAPSASGIATAKNKIAQGGFDPSTIRTFREMSLGDSNIQSLRKLVAQSQITPAQAAFPDVLGDPQITASARSAAAALRSFAGSLV